MPLARGAPMRYTDDMQPPLDPKSPSVLVALRLPAALLARVDDAAKVRGLTRSATVRALVVEALARRTKK